MNMKKSKCNEMGIKCVEPPEITFKLREFFEEWFGDIHFYDHYIVRDDYDGGVIEFDKTLIEDACKGALSTEICKRYFITGLDTLLGEYGFKRDKKLRKRKIRLSKKVIRWFKEKIGATDESIKNLIEHLKKQKIIRYVRVG